MVPMRYLKLISQIKVLKKIVFVVLIICLIIIGGCTNNKYPNPTDEFYVNDYAAAFHPAVREQITLEGVRLYDETKDIDVIGGTQIVFASFVVEDVNEVSEYNRTDIYRQWEIGKNDMGILVIMFFSESIRDGVEYIYLEETQIEVGYRMEQYLSAATLGQLLDNTIYSNTYTDLNMKVGFLFYELLKIVYEDVYADYYSSYTYDMDNLKYAIDNYIPAEVNSDFFLIVWFALLFADSNSWYILIPATFIIFGGGFWFRKNRGGGGRSGGYGIFRRR